MPAIATSALASLALLRRQNSGSNGNDFVAIPSVYGGLDSSPHPGIVAGIVLGSVGGFLLLLFLLYSCLGFGPRVMPSSTVEGSVLEVRSRRGGSHHHHHNKRRRRSGHVRATETVEVRTRERVSVSRGPPPPPGDGPIIVEPPPPRVVDTDSEDEVVVIEEHSTPPRRSNRRSSSRVDSEYFDRRSRDY